MTQYGWCVLVINSPEGLHVGTNNQAFLNLEFVIKGNEANHLSPILSLPSESQV